MKKNRILILTSIVIISMIAVLVIGFICMKSSTSEKLKKSEDKKEEKKDLFSYIVYDNKDENEIKTLVNINSENGIEYIENYDGVIINGNGKTSLSIDCKLKKDINYDFKIKEQNKEEILENVKIDDNVISDFVSIKKISENQRI